MRDAGCVYGGVGGMHYVYIYKKKSYKSYKKWDATNKNKGWRGFLNSYKYAGKAKKAKKKTTAVKMADGGCLVRCLVRCKV